MFPPRKMKKEDEQMRSPPDGVIRFDVDNISALEEGDDGRFSHEIEVGGVNWSGNVTQRSGEFCVSLYCMNNQTTSWNIDVKAVLTLVHADCTKSIVVQESEHLHNHHRHCNYLFGVVIDWKEFMDNDIVGCTAIHSLTGFINDDNVTVDIQFWISNMKGIRHFPRIDFTDPTDPCHDVTLVVEGEKIYASKQVLAVNSPVFKTMFFGSFSEKNKKEIMLKDVNRKEFLEMLYVIYPSSKKITENSAEYLLKLGDQFQIACLLDRVEKFLIDSFCIGETEKLRIADKYRLYGLQEYCISELRTTEDIKDIERSPIFDDLSDATKLLLFSKLLKVAK